MPREKSYYRENLEQILKFSEGRQLLSITDVKIFCGIQKIQTFPYVFPLERLSQFNTDYHDRK